MKAPESYAEFLALPDAEREELVKSMIARSEPKPVHDPHVVDRSQEPLVRPLKLVSLTQTCGACPSQWNAMTDDGRQVYIRYRWGYLSVCVGEAGDTTEYAGVRGDPFFGEQHGDLLEGVRATEELMEVCGSRIEWPNTVITETSKQRGLS